MPASIRVSEREHPGFTEYRKAKDRGSWPNSVPVIFGETQWFYESPKGIIDLVLLPNYLRDGHDRWEIMCQKGNLFDDVEAYPTKEEAEARVRELLE